MLGKFLLIDQRLNETRLAIVKDMVLEDFDDELSTKKLKKGNVYIGRIMRIEHSLQAAFVDFGFEKHGFLAFSEIVGPDIPPARSTPAKPSESETNEPTITLAPSITLAPPINPEPITEISVNEDDERPTRPLGIHGKVHDFIKRQQLIMVQVIKDERGSKGAALTTYISLPGRYGFFLPNTPKASGISKKITDSTERDALKGILGTLNVPEGMSFILRSAAIGRKKSEIKRDYDFLMKTWTAIAAHPVNAIGLVYAEQDLLIRALRDFYTSDVQHVVIQGEEAFKRARSYIRAVFPSYAKKIQLHNEPCSLFEKFNIECQIEAIYNHTVLLPSGGSIVLNQTEALVSIDVNSSKSTQERNIEDTALKTNLEACVAIARNLKLRDLSGLIVIDFIDLHPNKRPVIEKALKDALATDRARLKIGKISEFGLLEMSRQRLRQSLMESNTSLCTTCHGAGRLLSLPMQSMRALRAIERIAATQDSQAIDASGSADLVLCLLNTHRQFLSEIEKKYGKTIVISVESGPDSGALNVKNPMPLAENNKSTEVLAAPKKRRRNRSKSGKNGDSAAIQNSSDINPTPLMDSSGTNEKREDQVSLSVPSVTETTAILLTPEALPLPSEPVPVKESRWARLRKRRQAKIQANTLQDGAFLLTNPVGSDSVEPYDVETEVGVNIIGLERVSPTKAAEKTVSSQVVSSPSSTKKCPIVLERNKEKSQKKVDKKSRLKNTIKPALPQETNNLQPETGDTTEQQPLQTESVGLGENMNNAPIGKKKRAYAKKDRPSPLSPSSIPPHDHCPGMMLSATTTLLGTPSQEIVVTPPNPPKERQKKRSKSKKFTPESATPTSSIKAKAPPVKPGLRDNPSPVRLKRSGGIVLLPTRSR